MTLQLIERHYSFSQPGVQSDVVAIAGKILYGTAVLRGIEPSFPNKKDHHLQKLAMQIINPAIVAGRLKYDLNFQMSDESGNRGTCNMDVLIIVDVDTRTSLGMSSQSLTFEQPGEIQARVPFYNTVKSCCAALQGFDIEYNGGDHHVKSLAVQVARTSIVDAGTTVEASVRFDLADDSKARGRASVTFAVLADLGAKSGSAAGIDDAAGTVS